MEKIKAFYFAPEDNKLRYGDGRAIEVGKTHHFQGTPTLCHKGLHASLRAIDALTHAPGNQLYIVNVYGNVDVGKDKICGNCREYLIKVPYCERLLFEFARSTALELVLKHCPKINPVVIEYLKTGDERIRYAAWYAASAAARYAARYAASAAASAAARDAASAAARYAARYAARDAARYAAWDAARYAARDAASTAADAAWDAARDAQNERLESLVYKYISLYGKS